MSAHVLVADMADRQQILVNLQRILRDRFMIEHATLQLERSDSPLLQLSLPPEWYQERHVSNPHQQGATDKESMPEKD